MKKWIIALSIAVLALILLGTTVVAVYPSQFVVITRLGRPVRVIKQAGPAIKLPWPIESTIRLDRRLQITQVSPIESLTHDKKNLVLAAFAVWRVAKPVQFLSSAGDTKRADVRIGDMLASLLSNEVASKPLDAFISTEKGSQVDQINREIFKEMAKRATDTFGIECVDVMIARMLFPQANLRHVFNRMKAERNRIAKKYRAEGEEKAMKIMADTDLKVRTMLAEANRKALEIQGKAQAKALHMESDAYSKSPDFYRFMKSLDALKNTLSRGGSMVLSTGSPIFHLLEGLRTPK